MDDNSLKSSELESATNALERILGQSVEEIELSDTVPVLDEVSDSNKVFKGKLSVLFVDIRGSVDLTDDLKSKKMVKVYRGFIRMAIQAIRYSGGFTRQFAGDCVMGVFQDSTENGYAISSSEKAVNAARYIHTLIDYCLNPALKDALTPFAKRMMQALWISTSSPPISYTALAKVTSESTRDKIIEELYTPRS